MDTEAPAMVAVLGTFAVNAGLAWTIGCIAIIGWTRGRASAWPRAMRERHAHGLVLASGWTALALAFDLWRRSAEAAGVALMAAGSATTTMLTRTHYGHAWMLGMASIGMIAVIARSLVHRAFAPLASIVAVGVLVLARSTVSHAGGDGDLSWAVAIDILHLVTVSLWAGAVWVSAWAMRAPIADDDALAWLRTLSTLATIVLTGLANTWRATAGSLSALWGSIYGTTLAAKVALVLCAAALGGVNRWVFLPRMPAPAARRAFATVLRIEAAILASVLMLAAVLSNLEPPM